MNALKGLGLALLGILTSLSLVIFGVAFTLNSTVLNPDFINEQIERLDISAIVDEAITEQLAEEDLSEGIRESLNSILPTIEQHIETEVSGIIDDVYDYLKGESSSLDLGLILEESVLNADFFISLLDELDLPALVEDFVSEQFVENLPEDIEALISDPGEIVADIAADLEPWLRQQAEVVIPPVVDYILGKSQDLNIVIPLDTVREVIRENLWQEISTLSTEGLKDIFWESFQQSPPPELKEILWGYFLESLPPEFASLPPDELELYFDDYIDGLSREEVDSYLDEFFAEFSLAELEPEFNQLFDEEIGNNILASVEIDEETIGAEIPADIAEGLADAEEALGDAREYIGYFQSGYWAVIALLLISIAATILIKRNVRSSSRGLGIMFLIYGVFTYAGILITKNVAESNMPGDIPAALESWLPQLIDDSLAPLQMLAIGCIAVGVVLLVVSFIYKRRSAEA